MVNTSIAMQHAQKIALEKQVTPALKSFFRQISRDLKIVWSATGNVVDTAAYKDDLTSILKRHYRRVINKFSGVVLEDSIKVKKSLILNIKQDDLEDIPENNIIPSLLAIAVGDELLETRINRDLLNFLNSRARTQADFILSTINNNMRNIASGVIDRDPGATRFEQSTIIANNFNSVSQGQINNIAITETQQTSELTKLTTAGAIGAFLLSNIPLTAAPEQAIVQTKTWNTIKDGKERASHNAADGQTVQVNSPFIVQGQYLMNPGDTSMGASVDNIARCRCSASYSFE